MNPNEAENDRESVNTTAAEWAAKMDRGLTAEEQDAYLDWLVADKGHREAMDRMSWSWEELDRLAGCQSSYNAVPDPDLLKSFPAVARPTRRRWARPWVSLGGLAASVALIASVILWTQNQDTPGTTSNDSEVFLARIEQRLLSDGSTIDLNRGAAVEAEFGAEKRLVRLEKGEAIFSVAKDPSKPFVVEVGEVLVEAVGTEFAVRRFEERVDVVVSEGVVRIVHASGKALLREAENDFLERGERGVVQLENEEASLEVSKLTAEEIERELNWRPSFLSFTAAPLSEIVREFNARNPLVLQIGDRSLESVRLSSSFWSDDVDGFVRLLESSF